MPDIQAVIFDLDGVIVSTDEYHFRAWKRLSDDEGVPFTRKDNERLRGVSRMASLDILLEKATRRYAPDEKAALAERKNTTYRSLLQELSPSDILPGVIDLMKSLKAHDIKMAIGSSSKNARTILEAIGLDRSFDVVVDGTHISRSKPDPEVFTKAADWLRIKPVHCLVVEDAEAGVDAAVAAGMRVLAVGSAAGYPLATFSASDLTACNVDHLLHFTSAINA